MRGCTHLVQSQCEQTQRLIAKIDLDCQKHNIDFYLGPGSTVRTPEGFGAGGFFSSVNRRLAVATHGDETGEWWVPILSHEYAHMCQWLNNPLIWQLGYLGNLTFEKWLHGDDVSEEELDNAVTFIVANEMDCERRSKRILKNYGIPVDIERYIKEANAYFDYYFYVKKNRKWNPTNDLMDNEEYMEKISGKRLHSDPSRPSKTFRSLYGDW